MKQLIILIYFNKKILVLINGILKNIFFLIFFKNN